MRLTSLQKAPQISPIFTPDKITLHVSREKDKEIALGRCRMGRCESRSAGRLRGSTEGRGRWILPPAGAASPLRPPDFSPVIDVAYMHRTVHFSSSFLTPVMRNAPYPSPENTSGLGGF